MTSIVIAAHNEASVIGQCLDVLLRDARPGEFDVTVVANGCNDDTAEVARTRAGVRVAEINVASKPAALNTGDELAKGFPRIYLDADIIVPTDGARALRDVLDQGGPGSRGAAPAQVLAAVPRRRLDLSGRPILVRAYFAVNQRLPAFEDGLFGRGMIALSAIARGRFDQFPDMVADDLFLDSIFADSEKRQVETFLTTISTPLHTRDLVRRLVRVRRGNAAMRKAADQNRISIEVRPANRWAWFHDVVRPNPRLAPAAIVYVGITVLAAFLARRRPPAGDQWGQDRSTRIESPSPDHSNYAREGTHD